LACPGTAWGAGCKAKPEIAVINQVKFRVGRAANDWQAALELVR
jgi:hypothetical protein